MTNPRLLITGAKGQLGQALQAMTQDASPFEVCLIDREEVDLCDPAAIDTFFKTHQFDIVINCAAYTAVDKAEAEPELADQLNHLAVARIAAHVKSQHGVLIHISTDYVFDGKQHRPYLESDRPNPQSVYGRTKLLGEQAIEEIGTRGIIIRTSWLYSEYGQNFLSTMLRLGAERDSLNVVFDQVGTPTQARDLASAIMSICSNPLLHRQTAEVYHYSNEGVASWYDFAAAIFEIQALPCSVSPIESREYPTPAARPHYSLLNKQKIKSTFNLSIPHWRDSLQQTLKPE
ncbi:dTDP-4-dehydrorhamnose reductase [Nitrincola alkalilacustris]|uniref:dTDP-4-dehydrorhamnose reductase n=1 Tax=Nitrincola alkalilacustris TaxID=1571224 RepID=UPI00124E3EE2|nr:dTDP-4-dehydrorhamnose reductase [Nitrincola alkalilacustris]